MPSATNHEPEVSNEQGQAVMKKSHGAASERALVFAGVYGLASASSAPSERTLGAPAIARRPTANDLLSRDNSRLRPANGERCAEPDVRFRKSIAANGPAHD